MTRRTWEVRVVTIREVASAAGVSIATVSRTLINPERVADDTRERVRDAVRDLGYTPNRVASGLRAGRTHAIGLLVPDLTNPYFAAVARGVASAARGQGLAVFVADSEESPEIETDMVRELVRQTDGLVLCSPRAAQTDHALLGEHPVVVVNQQLSGFQSLAVDDRSAAGLALEHLYGLGHRLVGYLGGPSESWSDARRRAGLAAAATDLPGLELIPLKDYAATVQGGESAAGDVIAARVSAVVAFNDIVAVGLIRRLQRMGVQVPRDLSVIGFDNTYLAELVTPSLTCVHGDLDQLGRHAFALLLALLPGAAEPSEPHDAPVILPARLTVRDSTSVRHNPTNQPPGGQL